MRVGRWANDCIFIFWVNLFYGLADLQLLNAFLEESVSLTFRRKTERSCMTWMEAVMFKGICGGTVYADDISSKAVFFEPDVQLH